MSGYLLDANVFIEGNRRYYGMDFCPAFWEWLEGVNRQDGKVFSIQKVREELIAGNDELARWARSKGDDFFLPHDERMTPGLRQVAEWVYAQAYQQGVAEEFLEGADYYLVAYALTHGNRVVTHETPGGRKKVKIPDVCKAFHIPWLDTFTMLRREGALFVLGS